MLYNSDCQPAMTEITEKGGHSEMANATLKKVSVNVRLENGTDDDGNMKYVSISLGKLSVSNFNADQALAIVTLLAPCLNKTVGLVEKTEVSTLTAA